MSEPAARVAHEHIEGIHHRHEHGGGTLAHRARVTAIIIAVLAAVLAVADLSAHRATKTIVTSVSKVSALATQYEAIDNHRTTLENDRLLLDAIGGAKATRALGSADRQAKALAADEHEIAVKRTAFDTKAEHADDRYSNLEIGIGALQMAIVLASVSLVAAARWLLGAGVAAGLIGLLFTVYAIAAT